ncbi:MULTISPECIES: DNA gyrase inhibitor YacG [unclassified Ruegeria]|uniref:DNA gyrase inhibitor YacG n=1 Tax=unclassified Ruegeria TaxID=2625375 RepID=UPI001ADA8449|nr:MULTISPECIES: DNA gyrase inhibitor YacG [unclassified Ruegeria]MBO9413782.1 DNA gyrase inhibitor YacG [Ruegeria sp. R8_1]MBO9417748.1 DNA gyrase inhibitor YacG [Ruegeria sp. R8_2]
MTCPICAEDTVQTYRPFCSKRCADLDLAKWLNGSYSVPSQREEDVDADVETEETDHSRPH